MSRFDHRSGQSVDIDGASIYYEIVGQEGAPALLLLHGGFGDMEDFNGLLPGLTRRLWLDSGASGYPNEGVERIACKALIARGEDDHLAPRDAVERLARRIPDARVLEIPGAGHVAFQDQPELFLRGLNEFLA